MVNIDTGGFKEIKPGLSAEVAFYVDSHRSVVRVPVQAIRWVQNEPFVALATQTGPRWRHLAVGLMNEVHAEVLSGVEPGDRIVANTDKLPPPEAAPKIAVAENTKPQG